ncbi:hypothetical protein NPIL_206441 [Nephila pilipes]|uniref:Uncharacterized protein n=1 Tax=Nephila pilipes TaxID=299642 RepID=A0A8X6QBQ4_NEPPI|nr:hypothetical protein NPIL_206441 [Nephila pilipes]
MAFLMLSANVGTRRDPKKLKECARDFCHSHILSISRGLFFYSMNGYLHRATSGLSSGSVSNIFLEAYAHSWFSRSDASRESKWDTFWVLLTRRLAKVTVEIVHRRLSQSLPLTKVLRSILMPSHGGLSIKVGLH